MEWEHTRKKGRMSYVITHWSVPIGVILPTVMIAGGILATLIHGISIKYWGLFLVVFEPMFIIAATFAGFAYWKYWEKKYEKWNIEKESGPINLPGAIRPFGKYNQLLIGIYGIPVFVIDVFAFFAAIFLSGGIESIHRHLTIIFFSFLIIFLLSFLSILNVMVFVKNPICGHAILSNPDHSQRHPDAKGNYWTNAWKIILGKPFVCLDCADEYIFEKSGGHVEIIKRVAGEAEVHGLAL